MEMLRQDFSLVVEQSLHIRLQALHDLLHILHILKERPQAKGPEQVGVCKTLSQSS